MSNSGVHNEHAPNRPQETPVERFSMNCEANSATTIPLSICTVQPDGPSGHPVHMNTPIGQSRSVQLDMVMDMPLDTPSGHSSPAPPKKHNVLLAPPSPIRTIQQKKLLQYCIRQKSFISSYREISKETGVPFGSIRHIFRKFASLGLISVMPYSANGIYGLEIVYTGPTDPAFGQPEWTVQMDTPINRQPYIEERREEKNLSILGNLDIKNLWPFAHSAGLCLGHFRQVEKAFVSQGWQVDDTSRQLVCQGIRYLDWQLERGGIIDQHGRQVSDPIAYWLKSLLRNGYYAKPKDYVDQRLKALEEQLAQEEVIVAKRKALLAAQKEEETVAAEAEIENCLEALSREGTSHPLWSQVMEHCTPFVISQIERNGPSHVVTGPLKGLMKSLLRAIYGFSVP